MKIQYTKAAMILRILFRCKYRFPILLTLLILSSLTHWTYSSSRAFAIPKPSEVRPNEQHAAELQSGETASSPSSFLPIWKLLTYDQKVQFVSGYIQGWKDAARVTDVAISFVRENPNNAVDGLEKLKGLYDLSDLKPNMVVDHIDSFYSDPDNSEAALSLAISASRAR